MPDAVENIIPQTTFVVCPPSNPSRLSVWSIGRLWIRLVIRWVPRAETCVAWSMVPVLTADLSIRGLNLFLRCSYVIRRLGLL